MIALSLNEIANATGGTLGQAPGDTTITSVAIDSRKIVSGGLFVALKGDKVDGAQYIEAALQAGATAVLTSAAGPGPRILVQDPGSALVEVARLVRGRSSAKVVAITGSAGKTLTKDFTKAALESQVRVVATPGNFNNELGVPLTICLLEDDTEVLVAEVGARGEGHIASLMPLLKPDVSVVINVGDAHLGEFGSVDAIASAKSELVQTLPSNGFAILNADDSRVRAMKVPTGQVMFFGTSKDAHVRMLACTLDETAHAQLQVDAAGVAVSCVLPLPGEHLASNALAALAVTCALGLDPVKAAASIESAATTSGRMRLVSAGSRLIVDDAYNASPSSMRAALKTLAHLGNKRPTWAVLGEMAELGSASVEAHDGIGRLATRLGIRHVVTIGENAEPIARAAVLEGMNPNEVHRAADRTEALQLLIKQAENDAVILIKASRAARLDLLVEDLLGAAA